MKIIYISNIRIPTERAHGIQIMKMCEAFVLNGNSIELVVPNRKNSLKQDPFIYYDIKNKFNIKYLRDVDLIRFGRIGFLLQTLFFTIQSFLYVRKKNDCILYTRDGFFCSLMVFLRSNIFFEVHDRRSHFFIGFIYRRAGGIVAITENLKKYYLSKYKIPESKILVASDAVDLKEFENSLKKEDARKKIGLPIDKKIILYTGHLYKWKGVNTLAESAKLFDGSILFVFVGGTDYDIKLFKKKYSDIKNILIIGRKPHSEIPLYLSSADVLVLPNSGKEDISRLYTSPMKLFEYMASNRPIVASDLPSIREILNEENSVLFTPNNFENLKKVIKKVLDDDKLSKKISEKAFEDVKNYTWEKRVKNIINFISKNV